jgi:hypothetical protein
MVKLYVQGFNNQTFQGSDRSQGVAKVEKLGNEEVLNFDFYAHRHPSFWMTKDQLRAGKPIKVDQIDRQQQFMVQMN